MADPRQPDWLYSIEVYAVDEEGLVEVRVRVVQDLEPRKRPVEFALVRWIVDPGVELSEEAVAESPDSATPATSSGTGGAL